ncbi:MAG: hypothetical protein R8M46_05475 [Ghiorsea sp.]
MQISSATQLKGIVDTQPSLSQPVAKSVDPAQARQADTISISKEAVALARSEVNESSSVESTESVATQVREGEFVTNTSAS